MAYAAPQRRRVPVDLTEEALSNWQLYATNHAVSLTALLEAMGRLLAEGRLPTPAKFVPIARQLDAERKVRKKPG